MRKIVHSCSTGYGEALMKAALMLDEGEVETVAHYYAAAFFDPKVDCILDIGGQDMKCIKIKNHDRRQRTAQRGLFLRLRLLYRDVCKIPELQRTGFRQGSAVCRTTPSIWAPAAPYFMNSKVKQAQKEGASVSDISAGLAYSVIKNALFKVIKVSDASELGNHIVVQGGTFYNDAVLRSSEKIAGCEAIRPDIAGIMGAFGAALIARERYTDGNQTSMLSIDEIEVPGIRPPAMAKCKGCTNNCRLTNQQFLRRPSVYHRQPLRDVVSARRRTRIKYRTCSTTRIKRLFAYEPLPEDQAPSAARSASRAC